MDIITAIQYMENGKLATNGFLKKSNGYMEYWKDGVFREHRIIGYEKTTYVCEHKAFSMAYILANDWELVHRLTLPT
jgi:hypothetical protein